MLNTSQHVLPNERIIDIYKNQEKISNIIHNKNKRSGDLFESKVSNIIHKTVYEMKEENRNINYKILTNVILQKQERNRLQEKEVDGAIIIYNNMVPQNIIFWEAKTNPADIQRGGQQLLNINNYEILLLKDNSKLMLSKITKNGILFLKGESTGCTIPSHLGSHVLNTIGSDYCKSLINKINEDNKQMFIKLTELNIPIFNVVCKEDNMSV